MGWLNIYAAVYNEDHQNIFDTTQKYGKQLIWISSAAFIAVTTVQAYASHSVFSGVWSGGAKASFSSALFSRLALH